MENNKLNNVGGTTAQEPKKEVQESLKETPKTEIPKVEVQPKAKSIYEQALEIVQSMAPEGPQWKYNKAGSGLSVFDTGGGRGTRLLKVVNSKKGLRVEFNVASVEDRLSKVPTGERTIYGEKEAKDKHMGTCRWIYTGSDLTVLKELVSIALSGFTSKVKEEPKKKETPAAAGEAPKQETKQPEATKPQEPVKANRQLTPEEMTKMGVKPNVIKSSGIKLEPMKEEKKAL